MAQLTCILSSTPALYLRSDIFTVDNDIIGVIGRHRDINEIQGVCGDLYIHLL